MIQQRIAKSRLAIPIMIIYSIAVWGALLLSDIKFWHAIILFAVNLLLISEFNNRNALNRQHNRKICCVYIAIMTACPNLLTDVRAMLVQTCILIALTKLFQTYQRRDDMTHRYAAYLFLGIGIAAWPPLLLFVPLFWIGEAAYLMSFSIKAWGASMLGLLTPIWFILPVLMYLSKLHLIVDWTKDAVPNTEVIQSAFSNIGMSSNGNINMAYIVFIFVILIISIAKYIQLSYNDKIHVRMLHHFLIFIAIPTAVSLAVMYLLPLSTTQGLNCIIAILAAVISPAATQYITLTTSRTSGITTIILLIISIILTIGGIKYGI